jgi:O-antigen/teichoic acid export membrane protein
MFQKIPMADQSVVLDIFSTEHLHNDLKGRSVRGGMLTVSSQATQFLLQSISTVVLARLLTPADFGLVAMVTAITGLAQAFADLGLSEATIQHPEIGHRQVSTLFWINVGIGLALTMLTAALAPVFAWFYKEPRVEGITLLVSVTFLIGGLRVQHDALLKRQMRFTSLAIRDIAAYVLGVAVAVTLAIRGIGYWAIVALPLTLNTTAMILSWVMVPWIPSLPKRGTQVRTLVSFGGNVAASYLLLNVMRNADSVLLGWYLGAGPLGLYSRACNLLMLPVRQLVVPAGSVAIPAFSRIQSNRERLARYYLNAANLIMWLSAPLFAFLFVAATPVVVLVLGQKWRAAAPVFQILCICALGQLFLNLTVWLFVSRGYSKQLFKMILVISPIIIGSYAIGLPFGIKGVALSGSVATLITVVGLLHRSFRGTDLSLRRLGRSIRYPLITSFVGICAAQLAFRVFPSYGTGSQLEIIALGFSLGVALAACVPPIRQEIGSVATLLRRSQYSVEPELVDDPR